MKRVYRNESLVMITHLKNLLEHAGIGSVVKNDRLMGAMGEIPFLECWPELWVVNDRDEARAAEIIRDTLSSEQPVGGDWVCRSCGEKIEGQFAQCWQCGADCPGH
jgi:hypothetical protein